MEIRVNSLSDDWGKCQPKSGQMHRQSDTHRGINVWVQQIIAEKGHNYHNERLIFSNECLSDCIETIKASNLKEFSKHQRRREHQRGSRALVWRSVSDKL